ncbi:MAG: response regulator [Sphingomicrobium sp.]
MDSEFLSGKRVLVVEDEMFVAMQIEDMLGDLGCTSITSAATIQTALDSIAANTFDLATLDLNLNGERSFLIAEALSERHIPFAFATGYGANSIDEAFGDRPVLNKPYSFFQFKKVLEELVANGDGAPSPLAD